jgi:hypothetical protein
MSKVLEIFAQCVQATRDGVLITRANRNDKEFHFQNWFRDRLDGAKVLHDSGGRNTYPDFGLVEVTEGFEVKGLAYPGREADYDCNSQVPSGFHNGRTIYYVFGRYPADIEENTYPVIDLVICHGDFLNADHNYKHKNKSVKGFGSYGDIMIRDRKMYVAPTPFGLTEGTTGRQTLIIPTGIPVTDQFEPVGTLERVEAEKLVVGYAFNLQTNEISKELIDNPAAGQSHTFAAYRLQGCGTGSVAMKTKQQIKDVIETAAAADEEAQ